MNLEIGDIIFIHHNTPQSLFVSLRFWSWWNHFAIYIGDNKTAEITDKGFRNLNFDKHYKNKSIAVFRNKRLNINDKDVLRHDTIAVFSETKLDFLRLLIPFFRYRRANRLLCSEFVEILVLENNTSIWKLDNEEYASKHQIKKIYDYREV